MVCKHCKALQIHRKTVPEGYYCTTVLYQQGQQRFTEFTFCFLDYDYRDQITEKLEHVTPTVSVKTYGSLGKSW